jgi:hypothetical protein
MTELPAIQNIIYGSPLLNEEGKIGDEYNNMKVTNDECNTINDRTITKEIDNESTNIEDMDYYCNNDGELHLSHGMKFYTSHHLISHFEKYAKQNGFLFARSFTYCSKQNEITEEANKVVRRGRMQCTRGMNDEKCSYCVRFALIGGEYVISDSSCFTHTEHPMLNVKINGKDVVQYAQQLTEEELKFTAILAKFCGESLAKIRLRIQQQFPDRAFHPPLIKRVVEKMRDEYFGPGRDGIKKLIELGEFHKNNGGAFEFFLDGTMRLNAFILQTSAMRAYAMQYNDFTIIDGTHGTNKYGLILEPTTNIDCLGRSVITGIPICESEQNEFSQKILSTLGLVKEGATLMTDEGSAFYALAESLKMKHVLCAYHFREKANKANGLTAIIQEFRRTYNSLIFNDFETEIEFNECINVMKSKIQSHYSTECVAMKLLDSLYKSREKVCVYYTKNIFTCGQKATSRGEGTNSRIKLAGTFKKELVTYDLFSCVQHILSIFESQEVTVTKQLAELITAGKCMSDYVSKMIMENITLIPNYSKLEKQTMNIWDIYFEEKIYSTVVMPEERGVGYPTCSCGQFNSTSLPCPCICSVCHKQGIDPRQSNILHPRWRLENHPLWRKAHTYHGIYLEEDNQENHITGTVDATMTQTSNSSVENVPTTISKIVFDSIKFESNVNRRYANLKSLFEETQKCCCCCWCCCWCYCCWCCWCCCCWCCWVGGGSWQHFSLQKPFIVIMIKYRWEVVGGGSWQHFSLQKPFIVIMIKYRYVTSVYENLEFGFFGKMIDLFFTGLLDTI